MPKITAYECEFCGCITKDKNQIFIAQGAILNGENELIHSSKNQMLCKQCFKNEPLQLFSFDDDSNKDQFVLNKTEENLINLDSHTQKNNSNLNMQKIIKNDDIDDYDDIDEIDQINEKIDNNEKTEDFNNIIKDEYNYIEEHDDIDENEYHYDEIDNSNFVQESEKSEDTDVMEYDKKENEQINYFDKSQDSESNELNYDYIKIIKILDDDDEKNLSEKLNYESLESLLNIMQIDTLQNVCIPCAEGINENDLDNNILDMYSMGIEQIIYSIDNNVPKIKKAAVFMDDTAKTGYISNDVLNQLNGR